MKLSHKQSKLLVDLLSQTRADEIDCDAFFELMPELAEGSVDDAALNEMIEHHKKICPPCAEALEALRRCLG